MARLKGVSAVLVLLCFTAFAYGCGGSDEPSQEQLDKAREEGAQEAREQAEMKQLQQQVKQLQKRTKNGSGNNNRNSGSNNAGRGDGYYESSAGGPVSTCATGVQVGPNTSCSFAMNVAGEYGSNYGASSISAYSPVTGQYYTMSCGPWNGGGTVCTGGNNASVYMP